jgi:hypothetical protein
VFTIFVQFLSFTKKTGNCITLYIAGFRRKSSQTDQSAEF